MALIGAGALRPFWTESLFGWLEEPSKRHSQDSVDADSAHELIEDSSAAESGRSTWAALHYGAVRNTLIALIGLFVVYLVFEFQTLWFREFPDGFYYAGYAHYGAAWLTLALALASGLLSSHVPRDHLLDHPRLRVACSDWSGVWSSLNVLARPERLQPALDLRRLQRHDPHEDRRACTE